MTVQHSGRTQQFPKDTLFLAAETTIWVTASQCFSYRYTSIYSLSFWSWINYEHTIERYFFPLLIWYIKLLVHPFDRTQSSQTVVNRVMAPFQNRKGNCSCMLSELLLSFKNIYTWLFVPTFIYYSFRIISIYVLLFKSPYLRRNSILIVPSIMSASTRYWFACQQTFLLLY